MRARHSANVDEWREVLLGTKFGEPEKDSDREPRSPPSLPFRYARDVVGWRQRFRLGFWIELVQGLTHRRHRRGERIQFRLELRPGIFDQRLHVFRGK